MLKIALFPGSFDPLTNGHVSMIRKACTFVDQVYVGILNNPDKIPLFTVEQRVEMATKVFQGNSQVKVGSFEGLTVEYAKKIGASLLIRGLRNEQDYAMERDLALANRYLAPELETVFLVSDPDMSYVSSSSVKELWSHHILPVDFVPGEILDYFK